jgi:GNAT superfamily N-acetyltransferase
MTSLERRHPRLGRLSVRPVGPPDVPEMKRFVDRLSAQTLHNRTLGGFVRVGETLLLQLCSPQPPAEVALAVVQRAPGSGPAGFAAVGRFAPCDDAPTLAEFAVTVADDCQRSGLGRLLLGELAVLARERGYAGLTGTALATNDAMLALARDAGFEIAPVAGEGSLRQMTLRFAGPGETHGPRSPRRARAVRSPSRPAALASAPAR